MNEEQKEMWDRLKHVSKGIENDFQIDTDGNIRYIGNGSSYTLQELYKHLKETLDKPSHMVLPSPYYQSPKQIGPNTYMYGPILSLPHPLSISDEACRHITNGAVSHELPAYTTNKTVKVKIRDGKKGST